MIHVSEHRSVDAAECEKNSAPLIARARDGPDGHVFKPHGR
jgi:hypothetical protein